jgi:diguanylate cyclase (GGDEF)-like protein
VEAWRHVPPIVGNRPVWIAVMALNDWKWLIEPAGTATDALLELAPTLSQLATAGDRRHNGWALFPLSSSGHVLGLLSVQEVEPLTPIDESRIATLAVLLSVAVKNVQLFEQMQVNSVSDALTGCFNRAHAFATLDLELRRSKRNTRPLSVVMFDIDGFKAINDEHGHLCGDVLLRAIGDTLGRTLRTSDVKCRYGGDEFLVILPDTPLDGAEQVAEHLRRAIERLEVSSPVRTVSCRISVGVSAATSGETDPIALVARVDTALYTDKKGFPQGLRSIDRLGSTRHVNVLV